MQAGEPLHTFRRRSGRGSRTAAEAAARVRDRLGVPDGTGPLDLTALFGRIAPVVLEIGAGNGEAAAAMAAAAPELDLLAVEVHVAGADTLLQRLEQDDLRNVRVAVTDAVALLRTRLPAGSLREVRIYFPDPWPKARHAKRRLLSPAFTALVASRLEPGGRIHVATDWPPYAELTRAVLHPLFDVAVIPRPPSRPVTRYEQRGRQAGRPAQDLVGVLRAAAVTGEGSVGGDGYGAGAPAPAPAPERRP